VFILGENYYVLVQTPRIAATLTKPLMKAVFFQVEGSSTSLVVCNGYIQFQAHHRSFAHVLVMPSKFRWYQRRAVPSAYPLGHRNLSTHLNESRFRQSLRHAVQPTRPEGRPKLKGVYLLVYPHCVGEHCNFSADGVKTALRHLTWQALSGVVVYSVSKPSSFFYPHSHDAFKVQVVPYTSLRYMPSEANAHEMCTYEVSIS
jgi:hypothetical protein